MLPKHGKITFLQLYVDSPHAHLAMPFEHPVSGAIVTCGLSHPKYRQALITRAASYLRHMRDLIHQMVGQLQCRIEEVIRFNEAVPCVLDGKEHFNLKRLIRLFERRAMLILFKSSPTVGVMSTLKDVLSFLIEALTTLYRDNGAVARYDASCKTFQYELALEELIYGHALSPQDYTFSVSLGTYSVSDKSMTKKMSKNAFCEASLNQSYTSSHP